MLIQDIFTESLKELGLKPMQKIAVAVSGGSDSMALALLARAWAKTSIIALTVDHKLRKESKNEAEQVSRWMQKHNIEHYIINWDGEKPTSNIQAEARNARYALMTEFCKQNKIKNLLVAHNKEDQAETLLIRLMRGSGIEGLSGISSDTNVNDIRILRPLLDAGKQELRSYLRKQRQGWIEDPSNNDDKYARVQVRKFINSYNEPELLVDRLATTCKMLKQSCDYIDEKIAQEVKDVLKTNDEGYCVLDINKFKLLHKESAIKILATTIKLVGGEYYKPRFEKTESLYRQILDGEYSATLGGCEIFKSKKKKEEGKLLIIKENAALQNNLPITNALPVIWDGRFKCSLSGKHLKDFFVGAITEKGFAKLVEENDNLKSLDLPKKVLYSLPALQTLEKIICAPHISYYENEEFKELFKVQFLSEKLSS